jgi:hypothetical protein
MSALNVYMSEGRADIFTDGAAYTKSGEVAALMSKVLALPQMSGALAWVGAPQTGYFGAGILSDMALRTIDEVRASFGDKLKQCYSPEVFGPASFEIVVVGKTTNGELKAVHFARDSQADGRKPFQAKVIRKFCTPYSGNFSSVRDEFDGSPKTGLRLMEAQRRYKFVATETQIEMYAVGGFCQHTIVTDDGVSMRVVRNWPDEIGKKIAP